MKTYARLKKELLKNVEVRRAYNDLAPEYSVIRGIIEHRIAKKMTQNELAKKVGTRQSAISRLESGSANPTLRFLQKVASALGTRLTVSFQ